MKKSKGFILLIDVIIFFFCSLLLLSTANVWKNCIMRRQQYQKLTEAVSTIDAYLIGKTSGLENKISVNIIATSVGNLVELQFWEDESHEQIMVNLFKIEEQS